MIEPIFPYTKGVLQRIVSWLVKRELVHWAIDDYPELRRVKEESVRTLLYDVFGETEDWQNDYFHFAQADDAIGDYKMPYGLIVTNYCTQKHVCFLLMHAIGQRKDFATLKFVGLPEDTRAAISDYCGINLPGKASYVFARAVNLAYSLFVMLISLVWALTHIRPGAKTPQPIFFAADFINDPRDKILYNELEEGGPMLMVRRGGGKSFRPPAELKHHIFCHKRDGVVSLINLLPFIGMVMRDTISLYRYAGMYHPAMFWRVATLPYRRLLLRGLFQRYRPQFFWGRDPYNEDHILRRQEINRVGGKSYAVNTGTLNWAILSPPWRYISYDRYYVFGKGVYKKYYSHTWAADMELVPAGTFTAERRHYAGRFDCRPSDIAIFISVYTSEPEIAELVFSVAKEFPERKIYLQIKRAFRRFPGAGQLIDDCREFPNVVYTEDSVYDIFQKVTFGISDPSSVINEALQLGLKSFAFDIPHLQKTNAYREYPDMIITSGTQLIERIRSIENESWHYPTGSLKNVVDMSGIVFFDRIREDMGLESKEQNTVPLVTNFRT